MYTVAVVDDVPVEGDELARLLRETPRSDELDVVTFSDAASLVRRMGSGWRPDILFMDIRLSDGSEPAPGTGQTGIDAVACLREHGLSAPVVYVSGYDSCHTAVYRTGHVCYLRKPFGADEVAEALGYAVEARERWAASPVRLRVAGSERVLRPAEIFYLESRLRRLVVHAEREDLETYGKLGDLLESLPSHFVRCHQSFAVNLDHVEELSAASIRLANGCEVPVSRRWRPQVREALFAHIRSGR